MAPAGAARADREVVTNQLAAAVGENRRAFDKARTLLLVAAGGRASDAGMVCCDAAANHAATAPSELTSGKLWEPNH